MTTAGQRRAVAAVLAVDVLDDLLAALVLEVDVDVGRLVALGADETLEQQLVACRVDLGDAERVADRRVGGAAAPLAQDALRTRPLHEVGDGQEVGLVLQLAISASSCSTVARTDGGVPCGKRRSSPCSVRRAASSRRVAVGHDLLRVLVAQLVEREGTAPGDLERGLQPFGRGTARPAGARAQVRLGIGLERKAASATGSAAGWRSACPAAACASVRASARRRRRRCASR
jgi:hypothetical protein